MEIGIIPPDAIFIFGSFPFPFSDFLAFRPLRTTRITSNPFVSEAVKMGDVFFVLHIDNRSFLRH